VDYVRLGQSGLKVSRLCLGCMTYGAPQRGMHEWTLDEAASRPFFRQALDAGINFFDTANAYSDGTSEEYVGRALREMARRDEIVVATKVYYPLTKDPNAGGLSRKAVFAGIDASLQRLGMDYVDLYQIHRWDYQTPLEETLEALHDVVKAGKVRYLGASSMFAWQFCRSLYVARSKGWTPFVSMQNHYNLLHREEEREMLSLCRAEGIGVIPWSPLARGRLTRPPGTETYRTETDKFGRTLYTSRPEEDLRIIETTQAIAKERGLPAAQIALAWVLRNPAITSPIIGASRPAHLADAVAAVSLKLSDEEATRLEEPYSPRAIVGFA
jgi:1-deoxyxylulose-5-phosphate synthase